MKKSKTIKLVLVSGLLASGSASFSNHIHKAGSISSLITKSTTKKTFAGNDVTRYSYFTQQDSVKHSPGAIYDAIVRGGLGFFGGHSAAS